MIAASARMSGTTLPVSSNLKRGSMASRRAAAWTAARTRAARTRRLPAVDFFVAAVVVGFRTVGLVAVETVFRAVDVRTAAFDCAGRPTATTAARKQNSREAAENRVRITGKPLCRKLLRTVSAL